MARPRKFPPSVYRHSSGQAMVRWQGRTYYLGKHGSPEAEEAYGKLIVELAAGKTPKPASASTVNDVLAEWWQRESPRYGQSKELRHFKIAWRVLAATHGELPASEFKAGQLEAVQLAMATGSWNHSKGWCRNVVNRQTVRIRTIWRWAERVGLVPAGAWGNLRTLPALALNDARVRVTAPVEPASDGDYAAVLSELPRIGKAMLRLQWLTGMRSAEVRTMRWEEIRDGVYRPKQHKNAWRGHARAVVLGPKALAVLRWWCPVPPKAGPVFVHRRGRGYTTFTYAQMIRRAAHAAGVSGFHAYRVRHSAKDRITAACGLDHARAQLGQRSIGTTNAYGTAADVKLAREAMRRVG